jgi:ABC-type Fe3+/spermidine/putrescine transport system ATPase subunit
MSRLKLENIEKKYGTLKAVDNLSLLVQDGELVTLLGPSGCGKTTTLRCVSGFLQLEKGTIYIGDRNITNIPPEKRGIGLVFQNYALWPHMTVRENLAFGLQLKKINRKKIEDKVMQLLETVHLTGMEERFPRELSGGQQQRVALARALILEPDILLLDEPLSNLDALLREQMRFEIARIHRQFGITTIYVTHDQTEAMVISDRIVLMNKGRIMQQGPPEEIYSRPANKFVAGFMGTTNFIEGRLVSATDTSSTVLTDDGIEITGRKCDAPIDSRVSVAVRPENLEFVTASEAAGKKRNLLKVSVERASYVGEMMDYELRLGDHHIIRSKGPVGMRYTPGETVSIVVNPEEISVLQN